MQGSGRGVGVERWCVPFVGALFAARQRPRAGSVLYTHTATGTRPEAEPAHRTIAPTPCVTNKITEYTTNK